MAVQAQYPSNFILLNRREQARKEIESSPQAATGVVGQPALCALDGAKGSSRKRGREDAGVTMKAVLPPQRQNPPIGVSSLQTQACSPALASLTQLQMHPPSLVSTGLGLASGDKQQGSPTLSGSFFPTSSSLISGELAAQINQQQDEIEQFLLAQGEQLRRALAEQQQRHYRDLLSAAEESATRQLREKEAEVERASRRRAELEDRLARLRTESMAWRAKALADQATAVALHAQLQQFAAAPHPAGAGDGCTDPPAAEDAESAHVDLDRVERERACRLCRRRQASVVLMPCHHLCLCDACDDTAESCPVCTRVRTGGFRVFFS